MSVLFNESQKFVQAVQPLLERRDVTGLLQVLKQQWPCAQLEALVKDGTTDAKKVAALALGLVGETHCCTSLTRLLADPDAMVNKMAEHALWSIWFRSTCEPANHQLCRGVQALDKREFDHAIEHFNQALELNPKFAEAYNQRALAWYFKEDFVRSIDDCKQAIARMPCHFGAWAGLGHCYAHLANLPEALSAYRQALAINPHLECVAQAISELENQSSR